MESRELVRQGRKCFESREFEQAYMFYLEAIHMDQNGDAYYGLGQLYYYGNYVRKDRCKAFELYETADEMGADMPSYEYIYLGDQRHLGQYLDVDDDLAIKWYKRATEEGESFGYECLGDIYFAREDYKSAFECFSSVKKGTPCAKYHLGYMYEKGLYVEQDIQKAVEYYESIIYSGDKYDKIDDHYHLAKERLSGLDKSILTGDLTTS